MKTQEWRRHKQGEENRQRLDNELVNNIWNSDKLEEELNGSLSLAGGDKFCRGVTQRYRYKEEDMMDITE